MDSTPPGYTKINVDGAICKNPQIGAISAVCRDDTGAYVGSSAMVFHGLTDPTTLEAQSLAKDFLLHNIKAASDYFSVVSDIHSRTLGSLAQL